MFKLAKMQTDLNQETAGNNMSSDYIPNFKNPPSRPDPFLQKPQYESASPGDCSKCVSKEVSVKLEPSWHLLQRAANWQHRTQNSFAVFDKQQGRKDITDGFYSAHESRFITS